MGLLMLVGRLAQRSWLRTNRRVWAAVFLILTTILVRSIRHQDKQALNYQVTVQNHPDPDHKADKLQKWVSTLTILIIMVLLIAGNLVDFFANRK